MADREVYFEFHPIGSQMRVATIDAATGIEVVFAAPLSTSEAQMMKLGRAKLNMRLLKEEQENNSNSDAHGSTDQSGKSGGKGILV
jgi:hypothetical protein